MRPGNFPTTMVLLGATGDLVARKILPSLQQLYKQGNLPDKFAAVGFSRRDWGDAEFRNYLRDLSSGNYIEAFLERFSFSPGNFEDLETFKDLYDHLESIDADWGVCTNKLFYLAVPPKYYETIFKNLDKSDLTIPCTEITGPVPRSFSEGGWTRVIVEKPFGEDLATARQLDHQLGELFEEKQIYRIDHYLAKEMLQNVLAFRFANNLLEDSWDRRGVEKIEIKLWEEDSVKDRGHFYDGVGALRDVGQNHALQMLALMTMDQPESFTDEAIRTKRAEVLKQLRIPTPDKIKESTYRSQHVGYHEIKGVADDSTTETYFKLNVQIVSKRWEGVPITIEGGKRLPQTQKHARLTFTHPSPCLCPSNQHFRNEIKFALPPREKIELSFWAKKPGFVYELEERNLSFEIDGEGTREQYTDEYSKLLLDCIAGDQTLFVSTAEVEAMWEFVDPILKGWDEDLVPLQKYPPGGEPR